MSAHRFNPLRRPVLAAIILGLICALSTLAPPLQARETFTFEQPTAPERRPRDVTATGAVDVVWRLSAQGTWSTELEGVGRALLRGINIDATLNVPGEEGGIVFMTLGAPSEQGVSHVAFSQLGGINTSPTALAGMGTNFLTRSGRGVRSLGQDDAMLLTETGFARIHRNPDGLQINVTSTEVGCLSATEPPWGSVPPCDQSHQLSARPVGTSVVRLCIVERRRFENDPIACEPPFQVDRVTPNPDRENVNHTTPNVSITFSAPVNFQSLENAVQVYTLSPSGDKLEVTGEWSVDGASTYRFASDDDLYSGTIYRAEITGGPDGVISAEGARMEDDFIWYFTTMLDLSVQAPSGNGAVPSAIALPLFDSAREAVRLHTFQVVRDGELTRGKPTLTRAYFTWDKHEEVAEFMQPDRFRMRINLSPRHPRWVGQHGTGRLGQTLEIWRHDDDTVFSDEDRRHARHTANFFGWRPGSESGTITLELEPHDPFPEPLDAARHETAHDYEVWGEDPGTLTLHYGFARVAAWQEGVPGDVLQFAAAVMRETARQIPSFFPHRQARAVHQAALPPIDLDAIPDLRFDADGAPVARTASQPGLMTEFWQRLLDEIDLPDIDPQEVLCTLRTERFPSPPDQTDQQMSALARYLNAVTNLEAISGAEPATQGIGFAPITDLNFAWAQREARRLRDWQRLYRQAEQLDAAVAPGDAVVIFMPQAFLDEFTAGYALGMAVAQTGMPNFGFPGMRVYVSVIDASADLDTTVQVHLHELGHEFALQHVPGDALIADAVCPDPGSVPENALLGRNEDRIEAWRMAPDGLDGWNKSQQEGNAEADGTLVSMMWPWAMHHRFMSVTKSEYERMQSAVAEGSFAVLQEGNLQHEDEPVRRYAELGDRHTDGVSTVESIIVIGRIGGSGQGLEIHALTRAVDDWPVPGTGQYVAELLDAQGRVLARAPVGLLGVADPTRLRPSDDPMGWQRFRVTLPVEPSAASLVIRDGAQIRARLRASAIPPGIANARLSEIGAGVLRLEWEESGDIMQTDVAYSPTGGAPWHVLEHHVSTDRIDVHTAGLTPGPAPTLRIGARNGPRFTDRVVAIPAGVVPSAVEVASVEPDEFSSGQPITLRFAAPLPWSALEAAITATDADGAQVALSFETDSEARRMSVLVANPGAEPGQIKLHFPDDFRDMHGNRIEFPASLP